MDSVCPRTTADMLVFFLVEMSLQFIPHLLDKGECASCGQTAPGDFAVTSLPDRVEGDWGRGRGSGDPGSVGAGGQSAKPAVQELRVYFQNGQSETSSWHLQG